MLYRPICKAAAGLGCIKPRATVKQIDVFNFYGNFYDKKERKSRAGRTFVIKHISEEIKILKKYIYIVIYLPLICL